MAIIETPATVATSDDRSYVDWPAIFAGVAVASAISLILLTFGSAIGLSVVSAEEGESTSLLGLSIGAGLWLVWVQVSGFMAGGYLTGRLRRRHHDSTEEESDIRDGAHGLTMWAVGALIGALIAFSGVTSAVSTAASAVGGAVSGAASAVANVADEGNILVDRLLRTAGPATEQAGDVAGEIGRIVTTSVASGTLEDADRQYLIDTVAARTGVTPEEAQARVDQLWTQAQAVEQEARDAAESARKAGVIAAFVAAASLLLGAVGAYFAAVMGGNHRDNRTVIAGWVHRW